MKRPRRCRWRWTMVIRSTSGAAFHWQLSDGADTATVRELAATDGGMLARQFATG